MDARVKPAHDRRDVTLRIDRDVLDFFQADGPGWQERINQALQEGGGEVGRLFPLILGKARF